MARIKYSENGNSPLQKLIGHNKEILDKWDALLDAFYQFSRLGVDFLEEIRRTIAYQIGCAQCMSFGCPSLNIQNAKIKAAVDFTRKMAQTNLVIAKDDIEKLKSHFSDEEIAELCAFIAFGTGYARFGVALSVDVKS